MDAISVENLTTSYDGKKALNGINFKVREGEIFGMLGPNGAGKTTTIRSISGVMKPDSGRILINEVDNQKDPLTAKMMMAIIPENSTIYGDLSAEQNMRLTGKIYGLSGSELENRIKEILTRLGLWERRTELTRRFSKGMKQRVSIGCAIIHHPKVLILDEPTSGLDIQSRRLVIDMIRHLHEEGSTIVLTTHNIDEANILCKTICIINKGKVVAQDSPERLRKMFDNTQSIEVSFDRGVDQDWFATDRILRIEQIGDKWRLYTDNPDIIVKWLAGYAEKEQMAIQSITISGPSLEEAFVHITEEV